MDSGHILSYEIIIIIFYKFDSYNYEVGFDFLFLFILFKRRVIKITELQYSSFISFSLIEPKFSPFI